ncbi:MAG TPA: DUF4190 domain-containing protein [Candidatus Acidoferrales bacterium]|nr:DUF4190 domain-containing protein [Candidatus Acidoferrales bacterium]
MWWKIYFWYYSVSQSLFLFTLPLAWSKYSIGDWITIVINIALCVVLYSYAFQKKILERLYWKILFWITITEFILHTLYQNTSFSILDFLFKPKHLIQASSVYLFPEPVTKILSIISIVFMVLILYALYNLSYGKIEKKEKVKKIIKEAKDAKYSKAAITSLVTGIIGFVLGPLFTVIAFITGIIGLQKIEEAKGKLKGKNFAWAGIICSIIQFVFIIVVVLVLYLVIRPGLIDGYQQAVKHMNKDELTYYNATLKHLSKKSTSQQVTKLLGSPRKVTKSDSQTTYVYDCPKRIDAVCPITIVTKNNRVSSISWWNPQRFFFYRNFDK